MGNKPRVCYWNIEATPYFLDRLSAVQQAGDLDVVAVVSATRLADRDWHPDLDREYPIVVVDEDPSLTRRRFWKIPPAIARVRSDVLISGYAQPAWVLNGLLQRVRTTGPAVVLRVLASSNWFPDSKSRRRIKSAAFGMADGFKVSGPDAMMHVVSHGGAPEKCFEVTQGFSRAYLKSSPPRPGAATTIGYLGRLVPEKGIDTLLRALVVVRRTVPNVRLRVAGSGHYLPSLRRATEMLGLKENVEYLGFLEREDLQDFMRSIDVLSFPTLGDPYGLAVREAMAAGVPVVSSTAVGEAGRDLIHRQTALLHQPEDYVRLSMELIDVLSDFELRRNLSEAAFLATQNHTLARYARDFAAMVEGVLRQRQR